MSKYRACLKDMFYRLYIWRVTNSSMYRISYQTEGAGWHLYWTKNSLLDLKFVKSYVGIFFKIRIIRVKCGNSGRHTHVTCMKTQLLPTCTVRFPKKKNIIPFYWFVSFPYVSRESTHGSMNLLKSFNYILRIKNVVVMYTTFL